MEKSGIIIEMGRSHWVRPDKDGAATRSVERRRSRKVAALSRFIASPPLGGMLHPGPAESWGISLCPRMNTDWILQDGLV